MLASLVMAIAVRQAFAERPAASYVALHVVRNSFIVATTRPESPLHVAFRRILPGAPGPARSGSGRPAGRRGAHVRMVAALVPRLGVVPHHVVSSGPLGGWGYRCHQHQGGHRMKLHGSARTCPNGRRLIAARVLEEGWTLTAAAEAAGVSVVTARKWVRRAREGPSSTPWCAGRDRRGSYCRCGAGAPPLDILGHGHTIMPNTDSTRAK
jgi:hypothetical protein